MNTKQLTKLSLVVLGSLLTVASASALGQKHINFNKIEATGNVYELTITNFVQTFVYDSPSHKASYFAIAQLTRPGTYCIFEDECFRDGTWFNDGSKLFENTFYAKGETEYANRISIRIDSNSSLYFTGEDAAAGRPINAIGFSDLKTIQIVMGADNEIQLNPSHYTDSYTTCSYDGDRTYTITGRISSHYSRFIIGDDAFLGTREENKGKKYVIESIKLVYGCNG